ncbi:MAG: tetratricopeptide repeat protein [Promethearchaeota archaeon]
MEETQESEAGYQTLRMIIEALQDSQNEKSQIAIKMVAAWVMAQAWLRAKNWVEEHREIDATMVELAGGIAKIVDKAGLSIDENPELENVLGQLWKNGLAQLKYAPDELERLILAERTDVKSLILDALGNLTAYLNKEDAPIVERLLWEIMTIEESSFVNLGNVLDKQSETIHSMMSSARGMPQRIEEFIENLSDEIAELQILRYNGRTATRCVTDLMVMDRIVDNLPYTVRDLRMHFEDIEPLAARWEELELQTVLAIVLKDERAKNLVSLYEELCDWRTPVYSGLLCIQEGNLRQARHHFALWTNTQYGRSEFSAFNNLAIVTARIGKGKSRDVSRLLDQALEMNPDIPQIWLNKGLCMLESWRKDKDESFWKEAKKALDRTLALDSNNAQAHIAIGELLLGKGDESTALKYYEEAFPNQPDDLKILSVMGVLYWRNFGVGDSAMLRELIDILKRISFIEPQYYRVWSALGNSLLLGAEFEKARNALMKALELEVNSQNRAKFLSNVGVTYAKEDKIEEAEEMLRKATEEDPNCPEISYNLGLVLHSQNMCTAALNHYLKAMKLKENFPECLYNMGMLLESLGHIDRAIKAYQNCSELDETHFRSRARLGSLLISQGEFDEAEVALLEALSMNSEDGKLWFEIGQLIDETERKAINLEGIGMGSVNRKRVRNRAGSEENWKDWGLSDYELVGIYDEEFMIIMEL